MLTTSAAEGFMIDSRLKELAKLCVNYSVEVKPKEKVVIEGSVQALPLMRELYRECLVCGAYPHVMPNPETLDIFFKHASNDQLTFVSPFSTYMMENVDVHIGIFCESNTKYLSSADPEKIAVYSAARRKLMDIFFRRTSEKKLRWSGLPYPGIALAQEASMSLEEYEDFMFESCLVDKEDPISEWKQIEREQKRICDLLDRAETIHILGDDTDLKFSVKGRKWINCSGRENMPDGEVFTAPIENSANGSIRFNYPGIYMSREVEDISLTFEDGKVVRAKAAKGDELLQNLLKVEGADRIGEAAIGTNYGIRKFTKNMLFDEKMGGTIHIAIGSSYPESGGTNRSSLHWDILKDMRKGGEIYADGNLIYKDGKFII